MTEAMPFLQKYDITFLRPPTIRRGELLCCWVQPLFRSIFVLFVSPRSGWTQRSCR